ncbi:YndJ family transporter [Kribbella sp. HUAS MG21]|uniref:YndJ family transporter n=1 Tax=Kribbella sp. HUAS MG21 TaxID=3160966 RepID=A0AAU7TH44_9ACTN
MTVLVHAVVSLGMLVVVPLGLTLLPTRTTSTRWWFAFAVPGAVALWLPRGPFSIALASIYLVGTLVLIVLAARHFYRQRKLGARQVALYTALATPSIAALALVAERSSYELFGFNLTVLSLTVAHFHFAGFAVVLTTGMWLVGWELYKRSRRAERGTAILLVVSGSVLVATMLLAVTWALGHVVNTPYLPLEWMVATQGVANAVGLALCGVLAMRRETRDAAG